tara:strand:- start:44 stop:736 length:693 start_codon:yes stop_codon:yes gene_type:complete
MIGPLTKKQITKRKWNIKNRQKKRDWDRKKRPWKYKDIMLQIKATNLKLWEEYVIKRRELETGWFYDPVAAKKYRQSKIGRERNIINCRNYRLRCKLAGKPVKGGKSSYNPIKAKASREKNKRNRTNKWFSDTLRKVIHNVFRRRSGIEYKQARSQELMSCSYKVARKHIESLFKDGMSWDNYGKWHMDHIIPCAAFDLRCPVQQLACCHYKNLQPLWAFDNMSKGSQIL